VGDIAPDTIKKIADDNGLQIVITHSDVSKIQKDTLSVIENHKKMGCENIGIGYFPFKGEDSYYKFLKDFDKQMRLIRDSGMKLHYHNHAFEFERFGNRTGFEILMEETDPALLGFNLDTYWVQFGGKDPVECIEKLNGRITCAHFKDFAIKDGSQCMTEVMEGNLNWDKIIDSCESAGVRYAIVEQDNNWSIDPFASLETSYLNLKDKVNNV
jgi:sugar phosphate isomerase/epimerase